jgi:hypothetical protein
MVSNVYNGVVPANLCCLVQAQQLQPDVLKLIHSSVLYLIAQVSSVYTVSCCDVLCVLVTTNGIINAPVLAREVSGTLAFRLQAVPCAFAACIIAYYCTLSTRMIATC